MVPNNIHPVPLAKVRLEPVPYGDLYLRSKSQIMVPWEAGYDLPPSVIWTGVALTQAPELVEYSTKPVVLPQPVVLPVLLSPFLKIGSLVGRPQALCPGRISRISSLRLPFPSPVEQISQKEQRVWLQASLELDIRSFEVVIRMQDRERREGPRPVRIGMGIDELRISHEDHMMRSRVLWLFKQ